MKRSLIVLSAWTLMMLAAAACGPTGAQPVEPPGPVQVTVMLDWVPNTNHTGIFVARAEGFFEEEGLEVNIIEPGEVFAEQVVSSGVVEFGVSFQEQVTLARADDVPIVSIAAIIQHNTSGFASRAVLGVSTPADWEGLRYGSFGSPFEDPTLRFLMECAGGNFGALEIVNTGFADPLALLDEEQTDLAWIFHGWQGIQADQLGVDLTTIMMEDWTDCIPDYYTPVFITNDQFIAERPEVVRAFLSAVSQGYRFAIEEPELAAAILLKAVPELDVELVWESQQWLSTRYQADASKWGEQKLEIWEDYAGWMAENGITEMPIDAGAAFTTEFLP